VSDIFISYAREDRERASQLAQAFGALGWSVWWDREILTGQSFDQTIERELDAARCVVVLWSTHSVNSEWVRSEAAAGAARGVLIPARIDPVKLPLEFSRKQTADLTGWHGETSHSGFQEACAAAAALLGGARGKPQPLRQQPARRKVRWMPAAIALLAVMFGAAVYQLGPWHGPRGGGPASAGEEPSIKPGELANLVTGTYLGDIISDSKGSSRSDVIVAIQRLDRTKVRIRSNNQRIGTFEVDLTRIGDNLYNAGGDSVFIAYPSKNPPELALTARGEVSYTGKKQTNRPR
jgi:hypothetical protein